MTERDWINYMLIAIVVVLALVGWAMNGSDG
jgi:hypothetical protein